MAQLDISAGRIPHACLICAASHADALEQARRIAGAAVCSGTGRRPCGQCRDCRKATEGIHPDIITVSRLTDDRGKQKQQITVDQIRDMSMDAALLPNEAQRKVYIIDRADSMNPAAQNAALKLLEEPPQWTVFLLCAVNAGQLLPTVRSRCAEYSFAGRTEEADEQTASLAAEYIKAVSSGSRAQLLRWCSANEGIDGKTALDFLECVKQYCADMLCLRRRAGSLSAEDIMRLCGLADTCMERLRVNVGVKHIFGLLAVDSIAGGGNRGKSID